MAKKDVSQDITKVDPAMMLPEFMADEEVVGLEALTDFIVPPFIKIVQKQSGEEILQYFSAGDVILTPANALIAEMPRNKKGRIVEGARSMFQVVPILFYPEWLTWNPVELKGAEPAIVYRTMDPNDPVAAKARNAKLRIEKHPTSPQYNVRHVEHLNFLVILYKHALGPEPAILSFSRSGWKHGSKFANLIKMRHASLFGCIFDVVLAPRHNDKGDWWGFDVTNPEDESPWVKKDEYEVFKDLHIKLDESKEKLRAQYETIIEDDPAAVISTDDY